MTPQFWQNKRVLVTGHTGFKGGWLCQMLLQAGANICGYALAPNTQPNFFTLTNLKQNMQSEIGDIRDLEHLRKTIAEFQPEIVFHLAAQPLVRYSYEDPVETYSTNVMGTVNLLETIRSTDSVAAIVNVTTDKCYENNEWCWGYRESDRLGGHDPYSNSKACAELVTSSYRHLLKNKALASARAGNVIGGGDWSQDRLVPDIINAIQKGESVKIRNPHAVRPWQHVLEPVTAYMLLAEKLYHEPNNYSEAWNFGPNLDNCLSVGEMTDGFTALWDNATWESSAENNAPHEANLLKLDISKAKNKLNWRPTLDHTQAIQMTAQWYKAFHDGMNILDFTLQQIDSFNKQLFEAKNK